MSKYGIYIGTQTNPELVRFSDQQMASHKDWIATIKSLITAQDAGILHRDLLVAHIANPDQAVRVNIYGDTEALWEPVSPLNRNATGLLNALGDPSYLVGSVVILPFVDAPQGAITVQGWERDQASQVLDQIGKHLFYHRKYNYKRRHEYGGAPSHPQLDGRGA
jgi:hypothetical protein